MVLAFRQLPVPTVIHLAGAHTAHGGPKLTAQFLGGSGYKTEAKRLRSEAFCLRHSLAQVTEFGAFGGIDFPNLILVSVSAPTASRLRETTGKKSMMCITNIT